MQLIFTNSFVNNISTANMSVLACFLLLVSSFPNQTIKQARSNISYQSKRFSGVTAGGPKRLDLLLSLRCECVRDIPRERSGVCHPNEQCATYAYAYAYTHALFPAAEPFFCLSVALPLQNHFSSPHFIPPISRPMQLIKKNRGERGKWAPFQAWLVLG